MRSTPAKKAWIVALAASAIVAMSAANAFAAPVLQPGVTSAPGMSGVCTDCHTYATPPVVTPPVVTPPVTPPVVTPPVTPPVVTPPVVDPPVVTPPVVVPPVVDPPVVTPPVVTPPVVDPPVVTPPTTGDNQGSGSDDAPSFRGDGNGWHHHHSRHHHERD